MRSTDITSALDVGKKWTKQIKAEERSPGTRRYRSSMYTASHKSLKKICLENMEATWMKASGGGSLPTHWRQIFYVMRPIVAEHPESNKELRDDTFKNILEEYLDEHGPGWDILRGARGVFKEPHRADNDNGLAMSTMNVRDYLGGGQLDGQLAKIPTRFPTRGARNRIAAVLICEKEGFDQLLEAEHIPERFDLALMSTKGISARAARELAGSLGAPCFKLHDMDKNGFVMAGGFPFATDIGLRMEDVDKWDLEPEPQLHQNWHKTYKNLLRNGASDAEAKFIADGQRVELNMLTGPDFIEFVEGELIDHGVKKVIPNNETLKLAWERTHKTIRINKVIESPDEPALAALGEPIPPMPDDLAEQILDAFEDAHRQSWDEALYDIAAD
jgi:hypothetical protein